MKLLDDKLGTPEASTRLSLGANVFLLALKFVGGFFGDSKALIADCINSMLDLVANAAILFGLNLANKPADADHQYGHGNADVLAASFVALVIFVTGIYIGYDSIHIIIDRSYRVPTRLATIAAIITIVIKAILYKYTLNIGKKSKSPAVLANAQDHKSDVYASSGALFGIIAAQFGYPVLDPIGGLWVSFFILRNAINLIRDNVHTLMGGAPPRYIVDMVTKTAAEIDSVEGIVATRMRTLGSKHVVDIEIYVDRDLSVWQGHSIAEQVRSRILNKYDDIIDVMVHVEPSPR